MFPDPAFRGRQTSLPSSADGQALDDGDKALARLAGPVEPRQMTEIARQLRVCTERATGDWAKGVVRQQAEYLELLHGKVKTFRAQALPRPFVVGWVLVTALTGVGVLWPLTILPGLPGLGRSKQFMLALFGAGAVGFVVYLATELWDLRRLGRRFAWRRPQEN